jgi:hypothetical protein
MSSEEVTGCGGQRPVPDVRPTQTHTTHTHTHTHTHWTRAHTHRHTWQCHTQDWPFS